MFFGLAMLLAIYVAWKLLVGGLLWRSILFFAGWFGIYCMLWFNAPSSHHTTLIFNVACPWAGIIATSICILALLTTKE